jgi:nicotinate phosphoribosyltransferase
MWTMVHQSEREAFDNYLQVYPTKSVLLVDTYDTLQGTLRACQAAARAGGQKALHGVRVDAGLLDDQERPTGICRAMREVLDREGFSETQIIVSGDMNEYRMAALLDGGEPIDGFGVGTKLVCSPDAPSLGGVYKVVQVGRGDDAVPVMKLSTGKRTYPGPHQVIRQRDRDGWIVADHLVLADETMPGEPLLQPVLRGGELVAEGLDDLEAIRRHAGEELASLHPEALLAEEDAVTVRPSLRLGRLAEETAARYAAELQER